MFQYSQEGRCLHGHQQVQQHQKDPNKHTMKTDTIPCHLYLISVPKLQLYISFKDNLI